jgi:hypothetical protein
VAFVFLAAKPAWPDDLATAQAPGRTVTATGRGTVSAEVDAALLTVALTAEGSFAQDAMDADAGKVKRLVKALHEGGTADGDVSSSPVRITPRLVPSISSSNAQGGIAISGQQTIPAAKRAGFLASSSVTIKTRDLSSLGALVDRLGDYAESDALSVSYEVEGRQKFVDEARQRAFDDAEHIAHLEADRAHLKLSQVRSIRDAAAQNPPTDTNNIVNTPGILGNQGKMFITLKGGPQSFSAALEVEWNVEP